MHLLDDDNTALSVTVAAALARIDPDRAQAPLMAAIVRRRDWPRTSVSTILNLLGDERISEPLAVAVRQGDENTRAYLMTFAQLISADIADGLAVEMLSDSHDPRILAVSLKLVSGRHGLPRYSRRP